MNQDDPILVGARREWLKRAFLGAALTPLLLREALAARKQESGMVMIKGEVLVNGRAASTGTMVAPGDSVTTAPGALAVFAIGNDAFLLRQNSELLTTGGGALAASLRLVTGKLLSVFGSGRRSIATPTATIGIRGTGVYLEVESERTYVCTCYGVVELQANNMPAATETVSTTHHDAPRYVYAHGDMPIKMIKPAPVINHSDAELIMLEALVGREPPFVGSGRQYLDY